MKAVKVSIVCLGVAALLSVSSLAYAQAPELQSAAAPKPKPTPRQKNGHPDLTGNWAGMTGSFPGDFAVTRTADGSIFAQLGNLGGRPPPGAGRTAGASPDPAALMAGRMPPLKPELAAKAAELYKNGADEDKVVNCGQPGLPRVGAPQKIVQTPTEMVMLYSDVSGMVWRVIPLDGRKHRDSVDPAYYGDSVGHWEGDTLVIDTRNFSEDTWMGEFGSFHSDQMRITERIRRDGDKLTWQATVVDPEVLTQPWVKSPVVVTFTNHQIEEPAVCVPTHYKDPAGHHIQRF